MAKKIGIIGGGIAGTALGYNLSLYGDEAEIHVFEKDRIGCGTAAPVRAESSSTRENSSDADAWPEIASKTLGANL